MLNSNRQVQNTTFKADKCIQLLHSEEQGKQEKQNRLCHTKTAKTSLQEAVVIISIFIVWF
jgi:hypothetical protein